MTRVLTRSQALEGNAMSRLIPWRAAWLAFTCAGCVVAMLPAQRTWIVDNTAGPGHDFTDLTVAYAAISPGDTLHVRNTAIPYQMPSSMTKGARIMGLGPGRVRAFCPDPLITVPVGELLVIDGFEVACSGVSGYPFGVFQTRGRVILSNLYSTPSNRQGLWSRESSPIVLADCILEAPVACLSTGSTVFLQNCRAFSHWSMSFTAWTWAPVEVTNGALLWILGGQYTGGEGSWYCDPWRGPIEYPPGPAVHAYGGRVFVAGPAVIEGGWQPYSPCGVGGGRRDPFGIWNACTPGVNDIAYDPMMVGRFQGCPPGLGVIVAHEFPAVIPGPAMRNQQQTFDLYGPTQSIVALFASFAHPYDPIVLPVGDVWLDPTLVVCVGVAPVDAQRHASMQTRIPGWLAIGDVLVYQAVSLSQQSTFEISPPGFSVIH